MCTHKSTSAAVTAGKLCKHLSPGQCGRLCRGQFGHPEQCSKFTCLREGSMQSMHLRKPSIYPPSFHAQHQAGQHGILEACRLGLATIRRRSILGFSHCREALALVHTVKKLGHAQKHLLKWKCGTFPPLFAADRLRAQLGLGSWQPDRVPKGSATRLGGPSDKELQASCATTD